MPSLSLDKFARNINGRILDSHCSPPLTSTCIVVVSFLGPCSFPVAHACCRAFSPFCSACPRTGRRVELHLCRTFLFTRILFVFHLHIWYLFSLSITSCIYRNIAMCCLYISRLLRPAVPWPLAHLMVMVSTGSRVGLPNGRGSFSPLLLNFFFLVCCLAHSRLPSWRRSGVRRTTSSRCNAVGDKILTAAGFSISRIFTVLKSCAFAALANGRWRERPWLFLSVNLRRHLCKQNSYGRPVLMFTDCVLSEI